MCITVVSFSKWQERFLTVVDAYELMHIVSYYKDDLVFFSTKQMSGVCARPLIAHLDELRFVDFYISAVFGLMHSASEFVYWMFMINYKKHS